ncbi:hypothetical protein DFH09DRAFT_1073325 [Mycena vulgaris]|nr:hypothetical protein DFH09DRAFT_1073325 [Mycena vulgaris]
MVGARGPATQVPAATKYLVVALLVDKGMEELGPALVFLGIKMDPTFMNIFRWRLERAKAQLLATFRHLLVRAKEEKKWNYISTLILSLSGAWSISSSYSHGGGSGSSYLQVSSRGWIMHCQVEMCCRASNQNQQIVQNPNTLRLAGKLSMVIAEKN